MSGFLPLRFTNCKREHHRATSNYEDPSLGPILQRHDAESSSLGPILKRHRAENSRPGPLPKSYHAMHGRRRIRAVRKRNEHFQLVKNYAREQADYSLPLTVPHPPSRQESPPTGWLQQLKRKAILWALHPPCFFRRPPIRAERILRHRAANRRRWIWLQKREKFFCRGLSFEVVPNSLSQSHDLGLVTQLLPWLGLLLFLNELGCASQSAGVCSITCVSESRAKGLRDAPLPWMEQVLWIS